MIIILYYSVGEYVKHIYYVSEAIQTNSQDKTKQENSDRTPIYAKCTYMQLTVFTNPDTVTRATIDSPLTLVLIVGPRMVTPFH